MSCISTDAVSSSVSSAASLDNSGMGESGSNAGVRSVGDITQYGTSIGTGLEGFDDDQLEEFADFLSEFFEGDDAAEAEILMLIAAIKRDRRQAAVAHTHVGRVARRPQITMENAGHFVGMSVTFLKFLI